MGLSFDFCDLGMDRNSSSVGVIRVSLHVPVVERGVVVIVQLLDQPLVTVCEDEAFR